MTSWPDLKDAINVLPIRIKNCSMKIFLGAVNGWRRVLFLCYTPHYTRPEFFFFFYVPTPSKSATLGRQKK